MQQRRLLVWAGTLELAVQQTRSLTGLTHNLSEAVRLGHRVVVLSRRPGAIRTVVHIDVPLAERKAREAELSERQRDLWELLRAEALAADRELIDA